MEMDILHLNLHESIDLPVGGLTVVRVPTGWIYYTTKHQDKLMNGTFVPESI